MRRIVVVMTGVLFLAGTSLVQAKEATDTAKKTEKQFKISELKLFPKKPSTDAKVAKKTQTNAEKKAQVSPQAQPKKHKSFIDNVFQKSAKPEKQANHNQSKVALQKSSTGEKAAEKTSAKQPEKHKSLFGRLFRNA
jgi:hypothetical protein